jgi:RNA polymerase sigma-70 factor (ECF subfamily)
MSDRTTNPSDEGAERLAGRLAGRDVGHDVGMPSGGLDSDAVLDIREARLFARAADGDRDAIAEVWRSNRRWIAAVLSAHAPRASDIDDLLQEVAATLVAKSHHIRDAGSLRGWLRVVAVNVARMAARSRAVESRAVRALGLGRGESTSRDAPGREAAETLALLARLPSLYAEPLLLQATQGLSQRRIAELLDVPETTVETRLARGRRMLRQIIQESETEPGRAAHAQRQAAGVRDGRSPKG